ncbi:YhgE/Pip domain-containing protein [Niallia circulans]|uniref:YhgE/Pip domain-containing protein n=1 Tax=Niallia circulans TaxID=1397 RepID=UPI002041ED12|nr:YhgE/Pip domain-containing protein [Niallia circulans]MCM2981803.1 YhgE/Pip domain-containing protein [Niallia circulans]
MKNVFTIYRNDWIRIFKAPVAALLIVALMVLPSLYAWFNLAASWDPYSNTSGIKIAVTSEDEGAVIRDSSVNIGDEIVSSLKKNDKLGWEFVSKEKAKEGVTKGEYYASLYIPHDFSAKIATILEDKQVKPEIDYSVNEKLNAIAPKMTSTGASTIVQQVKENFIHTVSESVLSVFNDAGIKLEEELPTIRNIEEKIFALEKEVPKINELGEKVVTLEGKLPEINKQAQKILTLEAAFPDINEASKNILLLEEKLPELDKVGEGILVLQEKAPEIQKLADGVMELDAHFSDISEMVTKALSNVEDMQSFLETASGSLEKIEQGINNGKQLADTLPAFIDANGQALDAVGPVYKQNLLLHQKTADAVHQFAALVQNGNLTEEEAKTNVVALQAQVQTSIDSLTRSVALFTTLNSVTPNGDDALLSEIKDLQALQTNFQQEKKLLHTIQAEDKEKASSLLALSQEAIELSTTLMNRYDKQTEPAIHRAIEGIKDSAQNAMNDLESAQANIPKLEEILKNTDESLAFAQEELTKLHSDLPTIEKKIHEATNLIKKNMDKVLAGINDAAEFYQKSFPSLKEKIHEAANFVRNDLPAAEQDISKVATFIKTDLPRVEEAVHKAADMVQNELPNLEATLTKTADSIRNFEDEYDLGEIISLLKNDIQQESDFISDPIVLNENSLFPIPNYGSANSPFYTTLSLWVGALLLISLLRVDVRDPEGIYTPNQIYFGRWLTFVTIGLCQSLIVTLGDMFILKAYVAEPVAFVLFSMFISLVFMTIVYTLVSVFGNLGKGLAIIFLVLQLSGSGGTFPIQVAPPFFQKINPYLPFTHAINLLRETVGGMVKEKVLFSISMLIIFSVIALIIALFLKKPLANGTRKMTEKAKASEIIH